MKIKTLSKLQFESLYPLEYIIENGVKANQAFISIIEMNNEENKYNTSFVPEGFCDNFIQVKMWDIDRDIFDKKNKVLYKKPSNIALFDLVEFIERNKNKSFFIHCTAGVSRSGAVAQFIHEKYETDVDHFYNDNPNIVPNKFILKRLKTISNSKFTPKILRLKKDAPEAFELNLEIYCKLKEHIKSEYYDIEEFLSQIKDNKISQRFIQLYNYARDYSIGDICFLQELLKIKNILTICNKNI